MSVHFTRAHILLSLFLITFSIFPVSAEVGADWELVNASAEFSARQYHQSIVFDNKMWVIGGYDGTTRNDTWSSVDGDTWILVNASALFTARYQHRALVFDDKMWVIGGYDGTTRNDTWSSVDGDTWTLVNASCEFSGRDRHQSVVFDNKMWIIGGYDSTFVRKNDTWSSVDGDTWTLVNASCEFSARRYHQSVVFDNKMWVIAGNDGTTRNDTWSSVDGDTWTLVNASCEFSARRYHQSVVFDNKMWVIAGNDGTTKNDTWSSVDGDTWILVNASAEFSVRHQHQAVIFDNKMWVIGGWGGSRKNDTWSSKPTSYLIITLLSQTPSVIRENSTGYLNISYGISHDAYGLNNTSVSFIFRNYDHTLNDANHSIRPPPNNRSAVWDYNGQILRAANRNESLNFENNDTITGGDIYTWSGLDENQHRLTIVPINSTYTIVNINGTVHDLAMEQMWYLDRSSMVDAPKTQLAIHKTQDVLIKFWDAEVFKGNYDFIGAGYTDTSLGALQPSDADPISFYYLNSSYDPLGGVDPLDSNYAVFMGSLNATQWIDHIYSPSPNASYVRGLINNTMLHSVINTTEISYLYFRSNTPTSKPYYINITNANTGTNLTFGQTGVLWIGDDAPYTAHPYTPNIWFAFIYQNTSFDHRLYAAGASGLWSNSTLNRTYIGVGQFSPTKPYIDHFHYDGADDYDMDGYYIGNFTIGCGVSTDPDGGTVTHNLTLHYANNLTIAAIINNTFTDADITHNGVFADIAFNSTPYLSDTVQYTLKLVATDDEGDTAETWLGVDFWLAERPPTPGFIFEIFVLMIMFATGMMMYSFLMIDLDNYTHVLAAFLSGIVYILSGFSAFSGIAFYGDDALLATDQTGWTAMVFIVVGSVMILYACVLGLDTAKEVIEKLEESTT